MGTACYSGHLAIVPSAPTPLSWFPRLSYLQCQPVSSLHAFTQASPSPGMHSPSPFLPFANSYNRFKIHPAQQAPQDTALDGRACPAPSGEQDFQKESLSQGSVRRAGAE